MVTRRTLIGAAAGIPVFAGLSPSYATQPDTIQTTSGPVRGVKDRNILSFKGVRYGEDTHATRFARPSPAKARSDIYTADHYRASAPQTRKRHPISEDCLFLNIWTPDLNVNAKRPVMVYIHGGAYAAGSGSDELYDGTNLATKGDVVVITLNHRLNAFGYLYLDPLFPGIFPNSGNAGQWDLILALQWINQNITQFGGDPNCVMVFGQSGGGAKIATMMASPVAKGLFHSAATMSGQQVTAGGPLNSTKRAKAFLSAAKLENASPEDLRNAPMERLLEAVSVADPIDPEKRLYFGPVLDDRMLNQHPFWPDAPLQSAHIPMILGNTKDETKNLIGNKEPDAFEMRWQDLPERLALHMRCDINPHTVIHTYQQAYPEYSAADVFFAATTAGRSWRGQVEEADARARQKAPTWVYQFNLSSPNDGGKWGAPHTIDIAHAFDNLDQTEAFSGTGPTARRVADQLSTAFIALARQGNPNHAGIPDWNEYRLPERATMVFDSNTHLANDPRKVERELFAKVPFIQWGT